MDNKTKLQVLQNAIDRLRKQKQEVEKQIKIEQIKKLLIKGWVPFVFNSWYNGIRDYSDILEYYMFAPKQEMYIRALKGVKKMEGGHFTDDSPGNVLFLHLLDFIKEEIDYIEVDKEIFKELFPKEFEE